MLRKKAEQFRLLTHYKPVTSTTTYREYPCMGEANVDLLVNQQPYWEDTEIGEGKLLPKTFIITDFSFRHSRSKYEAKYNHPNLKLYKTLLENGHKVFVWTGELTEVRDEYDLAEALMRVEPVSRPNLMVALSKEKKYKISGYTSEILDVVRAAELNYYCQPDVSECYELNLREYSNLPFQQFKLLIDTIPKDQLIKLVINVDSKNNEIFLSYILSHFQRFSIIETHEKGIVTLNNVTRENGYASLVNTPALLIKYQLKYDSEIKECCDRFKDKDIDIHDKSFVSPFSANDLTDEDFMYIKGLDVCNNAVSEIELQTCLQRLPPLSQLKIDNCKFDGAFFDTIDASKLKTLYLSSMDIDDQQLGKLLNSAQYLTTLQLSGLSNVHGAYLDNLKELIKL